MFSLAYSLFLRYGEDSTSEKVRATLLGYGHLIARVHPPEDSMPDDEQEQMTVVPLPTGETDAEHNRIRSSNDRDQKAEREGKTAPHNKGYDEAADGVPTPQIERVVDE
jgi:hypothetical protein